MEKQLPTRRLYPLTEVAQALGNMSVWTLRKHTACGNIRIVRIGARVLVPQDELSRIEHEGLPPLRVREPDEVAA